MTDQSHTQTPVTVRLQDYRVTDFIVHEVQLHFDLVETETIVRSKLRISRRPGTPSTNPLVLQGEDLELRSLLVNGTELTSSQYTVDESGLSILSPPDTMDLEIHTGINPQENTSLNGLYTSGGNFCTQCEAEGFRRMTYMYDRPDVMATYTTTIVADKAKYPVLLSNGNLIEQGEVDNDASKHYAVWQDPFPKPTYLFALVAGDLACIKDKFTTASGRAVDLHIYVQHHNKDKCTHAMRSLINAMKWDEQVYGREYDLDIYMIVAVDDFNMGAMENKGLNVFNSKFVLAKPETATDQDYDAIEGVIGHEYFHNWSGNRVTCRDWFQLSLKEGFTVFRDQEFSADMSSRGVKRIQDVNILRVHQFREDAGPMAHSVRPEEYQEINNFYTVTIYNKGAEVVRMLHHLLGAEGFRKGTDLYFQRHDGQAVTTDDFVKALEDANDADFTQFKRWYSQAGTPQLQVRTHYDAVAQTCTLNVKQSCPDTPGQTNKLPFHIPVAMGLVGPQGDDLELQLDGQSLGDSTVLHIQEVEQSFVFQNVTGKPVPSLLRGFSAPVKLDLDLSDADLCHLMACDKDDFNRWEAGQRLALKLILALVEDIQQGRELELNPAYSQAIRAILENPDLDKALAAQAICLPGESYVAEFMSVVDPIAIHRACLFIRRALAEQLQPVFAQVYQGNKDKGGYRIDSVSKGRRALKNVCLSYLMELGEEAVIQQCEQQYQSANNMTDVVAALNSLCNAESVASDRRAHWLEHFYRQWQADALVIDKWLAIQAASRLNDTLARVRELVGHSAFNVKNPNKVRSLIGVFAGANSVNFHEDSGAAYEFVADYVLQLNSLNPQIAARLVGAFTMWSRFDAPRQALMKQQLERILAEPKLSRDVYEIVSKSLAVNRAG
ncbi:MAG: aminopeptidase N [Gammaproteobacteria bacterium]|nr:aminopeptidase N [Gammaproteobacteria bacterium]